MRRHTLLLILFIINSFLSCNHAGPKSYSSFIQQAKQQHHTGYLVFHNKNGKVDSANFLDGQLNGGFYTFIGGTLDLKCVYSKGQLSGLMTLFYPSGKIKRTINWLADRRIGDDIDFDENGNIVMYRCFGYFENACRIKEYDSIGKLYKNDGAVICSQFWNSKDNVFSANKDVQISVIVSRPPHERVRIWISDTTGTQTYRADSFVVVYRKRYMPGEYPLCIYGESVDTLLHIVKRDTSRISLVVR